MAYIAVCKACLQPLRVLIVVLASTVCDSKPSDTNDGVVQCDIVGPEPVIVSFEGGPGCGKSTEIKLAERMQDVLGVANVSSWPEVLDNRTVADLAAFWKHAHLIDEYYERGEPVPETLQSIINEESLRVREDMRSIYLARRAEAMAWACEAKKWGRPLVLLERTTATEDYVFLPYAVEQGYLTANVPKVDAVEPPPNAWLFFTLSAEEAIVRISKRRRPGEAAIDKHLIRSLAKFTREYSKHVSATHGPDAVYSIDASGTIEEILELTTQALWQILHGQAADSTERAAISSLAHQVVDPANPAVVHHLVDEPSPTGRTDWLVLSTGAGVIIFCGMFAALVALSLSFLGARIHAVKAASSDYFVLESNAA